MFLSNIVSPIRLTATHSSGGAIRSPWWQHTDDEIAPTQRRPGAALSALQAAHAQPNRHRGLAPRLRLNKFREVERTTENPTAKLLAERADETRGGD
jgi:hypothetical protein